MVSKPLVSCLWGCGESVNPPKLNIEGIQGLWVPIFRIFHFYQITSLIFALLHLVENRGGFCVSKNGSTLQKRGGKT